MPRMTEFRGPAIVEFILEDAANIGMGTEIAKITELEDFAQDALTLQLRSPCSIEL